MTHPLGLFANLRSWIVPRRSAAMLLLGGLVMTQGCAEAAKETALPGAGGAGTSASGSTGDSSSLGSAGTGGKGTKSGGTGGSGAGGATANGGGTSSAAGGTRSSIPTSDKLRVKFHTYSPTQLTFVLENTDSDNYSYVRLASLRVSYWFAPEGALSAYTTRCDQIDTRGNALKCSDVVMTIVEGDPARLDIEFDVLDTWRLWGTDSISRLNVALMNDNSQGTQPDLTNDYSYMKTSDYTVNEKVAIHQDGVLAWGEPPEGAVEATGGTGSGGAEATGGAATGGAPATGGESATGGAATGGSQSTGGTDAAAGASTAGAKAAGGAGADESLAGASGETDPETAGAGDSA